MSLINDALRRAERENPSNQASSRNKAFAPASPPAPSNEKTGLNPIIRNSFLTAFLLGMIGLGYFAHHRGYITYNFTQSNAPSDELNHAIQPNEKQDQRDNVKSEKVEPQQIVPEPKSTPTVKTEEDAPKDEMIEKIASPEKTRIGKTTDPISMTPQSQSRPTAEVVETAKILPGTEINQYIMENLQVDMIRLKSQTVVIERLTDGESIIVRRGQLIPGDYPIYLKQITKDFLIFTDEDGVEYKKWNR